MSSPELAILLRAKGASQAARDVGLVDSSIWRLTRRSGTFASNLRGNVSGAIGHFGGRIRGLVTGPLGLLAGVGGLYGVEQAFTSSIGAAKDFGAAMELIHTQAGGTQAEVDSMSKSLLRLSTSVGTTPEELAAGLYHVESAGYRGAKALNILTIAAEGAKVGNADLESVTNALVGAEQSGVRGAQNISAAMGTLNAIVGAGNMRMQDLSDAMASGILASAKTFGVSLQSVGAALATMTDEGIPAIDAATRLRMSMNLLGAPTKQASKQLKSIGIGQLDLARAMRSPGGITAAMELLRTKMVKAHLVDSSGNINAGGAQLLSKAFGGGRSSSAIMTLVGNLNLLKQKTDAVNKGAGTFGEAWAATQKTSKMAFDKFGAAIGMLKITVGAKLLPMVTEGLGALTTFISDNADAIANGISDIATFAGAALGTIKTIVGAIGAAWNTIPPGIRDLLVKGFVADRTIKFLFGFSPVKMVLGLATGALSGVATGLGGALVRAGIGKAFVQPVFVVNMGPGLGGGSPVNPGNVAKGAGLGLPSLATLGSFGAALAIGFIPVAAAGLTLALVDNDAARARALQGRRDTATARGGDGSRVGEMTGPPGTRPADHRPATGGLSPEDRQILSNQWRTSLRISDRTERVRQAVSAGAIRTSSAQASAARKLQVVNARTADRTEALRITLAHKSFSPKITVPVHTTVFASISARDTMRTVTTYKVGTSGSLGKFNS